jgi:hypothetical protein
VGLGCHGATLAGGVISEAWDFAALFRIAADLARLGTARSPDVLVGMGGAVTNSLR